MKNLKAFSSAIAMAFCFLSFAQEKVTNTTNNHKTITGVVTESGLPLPGVSVTVVGTTRGVQTDYDGRYTIQAAVGETLSFDYIGFISQRIKIGSDTTVNVAMKVANDELSEVVVVGYGTLTKEAYVGTATTSKSAKQKQNGRTITNQLKGQVAGVSVSNNSQTNNVRIRGFGTANGTREPLYVVDGVPVDSKTVTNLDHKSISSVSVLKDSAATSIYGSRGESGVVIINTTKYGDKVLSKNDLRKKFAELDKLKKQLPIVPQTPINSEDYNAFIENPFESPKNIPLSTFSIDVDNASYTNVRRFINNGQSVPKDAVRVEEMINFFKYQYPQPKDEHPFSINTEYSESPWNSDHKLLRIGLQGKNIDTDNLPASNLVFLIDVSGSMSDVNKLPLLKQSMKILVSELRAKDKVSIVVYAGAAGMVLPPTSGDEKQTIIDALEKLNSGGSTAGGAGIELAYKTAQENFIKGGNNRVILATDGDFNVGATSNGDMEQLIADKRKTGVFLTCLGYGMGNYKDSKMETLADKGNGNYAYIDNIQEANRFLGKEFKGSMFAIAKDVKIQIEFNPKEVQAYRLIGYENRKLRDEDFTNDKIDAGELGSGHSVTALYEIIPAGVKSDFSKDIPELKYTKTQESGKNYSNELATVKFRYKKPDGDKSIEMVNIISNTSGNLTAASSDFKFGAAVAWFGLKLRGSDLIVDKSPQKIKQLAQSGMANDTDGYKAEFIRLTEAIN